MANKLKKKYFVPQAAIRASANALGVSPIDLATVISYETGGTFSPSIRGGEEGNHLGLIQFGKEERKKYGVSANQTADEQMQSVTAYLKDRGVKPGMGLADIYSTVNAGRPGLYDRSDSPGYTVGRHVEEMKNSYHRQNALKAFGYDRPQEVALPGQQPVHPYP